MNDFTLSVSIEKLESVIMNILYLKPEERVINPNITHLEDIKYILDGIFKGTTCSDVSYTLNTDKQFFGIKVNPVMNANDALIILTSDERVKFNKYQLEFDSKLFDIDLTAEEIVSLIIYEISSVIDNYNVIDNLRELIDMYLLNEDDVISIRNSANYAQLIIYALKDTLYKISSSMFKEEAEELTCNQYIQAAELSDAITSAQLKILSSSYGSSDSMRTGNVSILKWMFSVYKDIQHNGPIIKDTLKDAKEFTASKIDKDEIDRTLASIDRINTQTLIEARIDKSLEVAGYHSVCEISLFKSLKSKGLNSIENDLYEYAIRIKNCSTEEDAMYILRCINTRLNILEDYIYNTPELSEMDKKHWTEVAMKYRQLREQLAKKKIWDKKSYGLFINYDYLDKMDKKSDEDDDEY